MAGVGALTFPILAKRRLQIILNSFCIHCSIGSRKYRYIRIRRKGSSEEDENEAFKHQIRDFDRKSRYPLLRCVTSGRGIAGQGLRIYRYRDKSAILEFFGDPAKLGYLRVRGRPFKFERIKRHKTVNPIFISLNRSTYIFVRASGG